MHKDIIRMIRGSRLWAFLLKEFRQTGRNRLLLYLLLFPPTVQLIILGAALDPELHHLRLGICNQAFSQSSFQLQDLLNSCGVFDIKNEYNNPAQLTNDLEQGRVSATVIIPRDFEKKLSEEKTAQIQTLVDGVDAYTASIASADLRQVIGRFDISQPAVAKDDLIRNETMILYNPGLKSSWYIVPGILGSVLTLVGTLVSSAILLREKEQGTLEQLLMTPASAWEIIFAKIIPLFLLLMGDVVLAIALSYLFFGLPIHGDPIIFLLGTGLYICFCIGTGMFLGTVCRSQRQAQLCSFFINIPLIQLSGSVVPFESMPLFLQQLSNLDPLRYFTLFARASLLKGEGIDLLWPYILILAFCSVLILSLSSIRFRRQLG